MRIWIPGFSSSYGFRNCPHPWPFSTIFWLKAKNIAEKGTRFQLLPIFTSNTNHQARSPIWLVFPSLPISKSWWRGARGFSAIALAKADEDPDSGIFEPVMVSGIVLIPVPCMFLLNPILMNWSHGKGREPPISLVARRPGEESSSHLFRAPF